MSQLLNKLQYNLGGQIVARIASFAINMYLLQHVDIAVIGLVNVRLMLLYDTILFLTREPLRKANILRDSIPRFVNLIWLSPVVSFVLSCLIVPLWMGFSSEPLALSVVLSFAGSAVIEALAEPFCVIALRFSLDKHFALSQALLISLKRVVVLVLLLTLPTPNPLDLFCVAQVFSAVCFVIFHFWTFRRFAANRKEELIAFKSFRDFFPRPEFGFDEGSPSAVRALLSHSVLKQLLTDGSAFVMTFTQLLTLPQQGVYDAIERVGSLVCRMLLAPIEESSFAYFSNALNQDKTSVFKKNTVSMWCLNDKDSHDTLIATFRATLHDLIVCGLIVCVFGVPYSKLAVTIYGGEALVSNGGAILLSAYAVYVLITAINGVTECFAFASMNNSQIFSHGGFLLLSAVLHLSLSFFLCARLGAVGFILANMINMTTRIAYSWRHISAYLGARTPSIGSMLPCLSTVILMIFALMGGLFSLLLFGSTPGLTYNLSHLAVGGVLFLLLLRHAVYEEQLFTFFLRGSVDEQQARVEKWQRAK